MKTIEYIASGEYAVAVAEKKIMKVLLGSCVGVALYDREANIGGAAHLLLPEPASPGSQWSPGSYATTGLPLFIAALHRAGAAPERLEAVIAGGALFSRISQHDIALNIGGRCVERVHAILEALKIPIVREESCGFSPSILTLNTATWQTEITIRFEPTSGGHATPPQKPSREEIRQSVRDILPIPQAALKIIHLISEGEYDTGEVVATIESDQVLAGKILSLCNSALVGPTRPIETLDKAVLILGQSHLLQMVATAAVSSLLMERQDGYAMLKGGLYRHAVGTAYAAKILSQESRIGIPGAAYTAGLLHDIGKVVLDRYFSSFRPLFYQHNDPGEYSLTTLETKLLGLDHQKAGKLLADEWRLPESITQVIAHHHHPCQATSHHDLIHLVYLADLLVSWHLSGLEFEKIDAADLGSTLRRLGIVAEKLPSLIDKIPWKTLMYL